MTHMTRPPKPLSRRERRVAARRAQILDAAAAVFSLNGYENATTREIALRADLSEGTLYNYFKNKHELFVGVADAFADTLVAAIDAISGDNLELDMSDLFAERFRSGRERRLLMLFAYKSRIDPDGHAVRQAVSRIVEATERKLREAIAEGAARPVNPAVAAATLNAAIMGFAILYELSSAWRGDSAEHDELTFSPELLGTEITDLFLHGLQARQGDSDHS